MPLHKNHMTEKLTPPEERAKPPSSVAPVSTLGTASAITRRMEFTLETPMPIVSVKNVEYQVRPYTNFGKYEGGYAIDPYIHGLTLDGFCDEEYGSVTENGMWYGIIRGPISVSASDRENNDMTESEISFLSSIAGIIAQESDVGFVGIKYYVSQEEFDNDTKKIEAELSDPDMNDDEDDQI